MSRQGESQVCIIRKAHEPLRRGFPEQVEIHTFPGAGHVMSYLIDGERYEAYLRAFIERTNC